MSLYSIGKSDTVGDSTIVKEVQWFIEKVNTHHDLHESTNNQYIVYILYTYKDEKTRAGLCFTLGYIMNSNDSRNILPTHYFQIGDEYILVRFGKGIDASYLKCVDLIKFNTYNDDAVKIIQKLYPSAIGGFTYHPPGMTFCRDGEKSNRTYYENADEIPMEKSIWADFPQGGQMDLIREK